MARKMQDAFGPRTPIVPSIGNNDLYPHNIMFAGPSAVINSLQTIWRDMVPEPDFHTFARGAYFAVEVVPGLMVASLNTIYFFGSNKVVDGCPPGKKGRRDPGSEQLAWLETQLARWRKEGKQAWLSGHVPPSPGMWYDDCDERFREISVAYQDVIVGQLYGHVNVDYFFLAGPEPSGAAFRTAASARALEEGLRAEYGGLPSAKRARLDDYAVFHVSPSVVPTFQPSVRVYTYNTTAATAFVPALEAPSPGQHVFRAPDVDAAKHKAKKPKGRPPVPRRPDARAPSRTNRYLTPLGYAQWYLDLGAANAAGSHVWPEWSLEYTTYGRAALARFLGGRPRAGEPTPFPWLNASDARLLAQLDALTPYGMPDLTLGRWLDLARDLASSKKRWKGYRSRMFVGTQ